MRVPELQSGTFFFIPNTPFFLAYFVGMKKNFALMNGVNCPYVFNFRPYAFFRYRIFPKFQTFNTKNYHPNAKIWAFCIFFLDVLCDFLWFFIPIFDYFSLFLGDF